MTPAQPLPISLTRTTPTEWGLVQANRVIVSGLSMAEARELLTRLNQPYLPEAKQTRQSWRRR